MRSKIFNKYIFIFTLFFVGSFIGFAHENIYGYLMGRFEVRKGLIYEPLIPIYGMGLVLFHFIYSSLDIKKYGKIIELLIVFLIGFFVGGFTEYIFSFLQEKIFGTISWNYSNVKFNINGRTSLFHSTFWGIMALFFYVCVLPLLKKLEKLVENKKIAIIVFIISLFTIFDCSISVIATVRQSERRNNIQPKNSIDVFLDKYYPDEYLNKIFNNAKVVKKKKN